MVKFKLGARAYIYPLVALGICFFFYMHSRKAASRVGDRPLQRAETAAMPADAELGAAVDIDKPSLYLFGSKDEIGFTDELRSGLKGTCTVMYIRSSGQDVKKHFGINDLPCAILFSSDMVEMERYFPLPEKDVLIKKIIAKIPGNNIKK